MIHDPSEPPVVLTVAGSDSGSGAGLQADLKTFSAHGVFGVTAVTAVTAQNTVAVLGMQAMEAALVSLQLEALSADFSLAGAKTGMLGSSAIVAVVADWARCGGPPHLVVDPVLASSTGTPLLDEGAVGAYIERLIPCATVLTPNLREAGLLTGSEVMSLDDMKAAASALADMGADMVVVKGGHLEDGVSPDVVVRRGSVTVLESDRVPTGNDHGTGCTLSASIAAHLARGVEPLEAVVLAKRYVTRALAGAALWRLGTGRGPLDHFGWGPNATVGSSQ